MIDQRRGARSGRTAGIPRTCERECSRWVRCERGSASVLVALWSVVLTMLAAAGMVLSSVLAARGAVSAAADLAALAGASATLTAPAQACSRAREVARANDASLIECRVGGTEVWVVVRTPPPPQVRWLLPGRGSSLSARAHAQLTPEDP